MECYCSPTAQCRVGDSPGSGEAGELCPPEILLDNGNFLRSSCPECYCASRPAVYHVREPNEWSVWRIGSDVSITYEASSTAKALDIWLYRGTDKIADVATNAENTGTFNWTVPVGLDGLVPGVNYALVVSDSNLLSAHTPRDFAVVANDQCPEGHAKTVDPSDSVTTVCTLCLINMYLNKDGASCMQCPAGMQTPARGSVGKDSCTVPLVDRLANFIRVVNGRLDQEPFESVSLDLEGCAERCDLNPACRSFDFELPRCTNTAITFGHCELFVDNEWTAEPHTLERASGSMHYRRKTGRKLSSSFTPTVGFFATANGGGQNRPPLQTTGSEESLAPVGKTSVEMCTYLCLQRDECKSFVAGTGGRVGECYIYDYTVVEAELTRGSLAELEELVYYERPNADGSCAAGYHSSTGKGPDCEICAKGTFTSDEQKLCLPCPTRTTTHGDGASSVSDCVAPMCPIHSQSSSPDENDDCSCKVGSDCIGNDLQCRLDEEKDVHYFHVSCGTCQCTLPVDPPTIDFVWTPTANALHYTGQSMVIKYQASNGVNKVHIGLFHMHATKPNFVVFAKWACTFCKNTGSYVWDIPTSIEQRDDYVVLVLHAAVGMETKAPTHRNSFEFRIHSPEGGCLEGYINPETGMPPGCEECPIGKYWVSQKECEPCPANTTTHAPGSTSISDCAITSEHALYSFVSVPRHYLGITPVAGYFMEDDDHKTVEECARACLDDGGCKSFSAGIHGEFQSGDCFLAYDNRETSPSALSAVSQLSYFELKKSVGMAEDSFTTRAGCFIKGSDAGGIYENDLSSEACAQLCMNNICCRSFDSGVAGTSTSGHCFLSFENEADVADDEFVCDTAYNMNYNELAIKSEIVFTGKTYDEANLVDSGTRTLFATAVADAVADALTLEKDPPVAIAKAKDDDGSGSGTIVATVAFTSRSDRERFDTWVRTPYAHGVMVHTMDFPRFGPTRVTYIYQFDALHGPCDLGSVSQTGRKPDCRACREDTYANAAYTICQECPHGTESRAGAYTVEQCKIPTITQQQSLFNYRDEYVGVYQAANSSGAFEFQVTNTEGNGATFLASFRHGNYCDAADDCRTSGHAKFYYVASVVGTDGVTAQFMADDGWAGVTDRSFNRESLAGKLSIVDGQTIFSGTYGANGTFTAHRRCKASAERTPDEDLIQVGDKWKGHFICDLATTDSSKFKDQERNVHGVSMQIRQILQDGKLEAVIDTDKRSGSESYLVVADSLTTSQCRSLEVTPAVGSEAWLVDRPESGFSRQWSGHMSDDGEHFQGQLNNNPRCKCLGTTPSGDDESCGELQVDNRNMCWVSQTCADGIESLDFPGWFYAPIDRGPACTTFSMSRVCVEPPKICPYGWTEYNLRCHKVLGLHQKSGIQRRLRRSLAAVDPPLTWDGALTACIEHGGSLQSIATAADDAFVGKLVHAAFNTSSDDEDAASSDDGSGSGSSSGVGSGDGSGGDDALASAAAPLVEAAWIGLATGSLSTSIAGVQANLWTDGTPLTYTGAWDSVASASDYLEDKAGAVAVNSSTSEWQHASADTAMAYICERPLLLVNSSCECTGEGDESSFGDSCDFWTPEVSHIAWCYTSPHCAEAVETSEGMWRKFCDLTTTTTTTASSTTTTLTTTTPLVCSDSEYKQYGSGGIPFCTELSVCDAGQYMDRAGTETTDLHCALCEAGTYQDVKNRGTECKSNPTCGPGSKYADRGLATRSECQLCDSETYTTEIDHADTNCALQPDCESGFLYSEPFSRDSERTCIACPAGHFLAEPRHRLLACIAWEECNVALQQYEAETPTSSSNRICASHTECDGATQYEFAAATSTTDRQCNGLTACLPGSKVIAEPTDTSNRECEACGVNEWQDGLNAGFCNAASSCAKGERVILASTMVTDLACGACLDGTYQDEDNHREASCLDQPKCGPGQYYSGADLNVAQDVEVKADCLPCTYGFYQDATDHRVKECKPQTTCNAGEKFTYRGLGEAAKCTACDARTYQDDTDHRLDECKDQPPCGPGVFYSAVATLDRERSCIPCPEGEWQGRAEHYLQYEGGCIPWATCNSNSNEEYESKAPTTKTDRECAVHGTCTETQFESAAPTPTSARECSEGLATCIAGTYVAAEMTATSDRICESCGPKEWQSKPDQTECNPWTLCALGERVLAQGTLLANVVCTECQAHTYVDQNLHLAEVCEEQPVCSAGEQASEDTKFARRQCGPCPDDTFVEAAGHREVACIPQTVCGKGEFISADSSTEPRACTACPDNAFQDEGNHRHTLCQEQVVCSVGEYYIYRGLGEPATCGQCEDTTYQDESEHRNACKPQPKCPTGSKYVFDGTSKSATCSECTAGHYQNADDHRLADCKTQPLCKAGEKYAESTDRTSKRACEACPNGQWRSEQGHQLTACEPWQQCSADEQHEMGAPTATTDRVCATTGQCLSGDQYETKAPTLTSDRECRGLAVCLAGSSILVEATETSDRECKACSGEQWQEASNQPSCVDHSTCGPGQRVGVKPTAITDLTCSNCTSGFYMADRAHRHTQCTPQTVCGTGQRFTTLIAIQNSTFMGAVFSAVVTTTAPGMCLSCRTNQYQSRRAHRETACTPQPTCPRGSRYVDLGTDAEAVCEQCAQQFYQDADNHRSTECIEQPTCVAGLYFSELENRSAVRDCLECPDGQWRPDEAHRLTSCTPWQTCIAGVQHEVGTPNATVDRTCATSGQCLAGIQYEYMAPTPSSDRECSGLTDCEAGSAIVVQPTLESDRECGACGTNTWQDGRNRDECKPLSTCGPGQQVGTEGTAVSDLDCASCPEDTFQNASNHRSLTCFSQTSCGPGERYVYRGKSEPARCEVCDAAEYNDATSHRLAECIEQPPCVKGTRFVESDLRDVERRCEACPDGMFEASASHYAPFCSTWQPCTPGDQYESAQGTSSTDRVCSTHLNCGNGSQYESSAPTPTSARECSGLTVCGIGVIVLEIPTATTDRVCADLKYGGAELVGPTVIDASTNPDGTDTDNDNSTATTGTSTLVVVVVIVCLALIVGMMAYMKTKNAAAARAQVQIMERPGQPVVNFTNPMYDNNNTGQRRESEAGEEALYGAVAPMTLAGEILDENDDYLTVNNSYGFDDERVYDAAPREATGGPLLRNSTYGSLSSQLQTSDQLQLRPSVLVSDEPFSVPAHSPPGYRESMSFPAARSSSAMAEHMYERNSLRQVRRWVDGPGVVLVLVLVLVLAGSRKTLLGAWLGLVRASTCFCCCSATALACC